MITWAPKGITYKADPMHAELIVRKLGLEACRSVTTPGAREDVAKASCVVANASGELENEDGGDDFPAQEARRFRALAARANYFARDQADIQFAVKELARRTSTPKSSDMELLKQDGRYLVGTPRAVYAR